MFSSSARQLGDASGAQMRTHTQPNEAEQKRELREGEKYLNIFRKSKQTSMKLLFVFSHDGLIFKRPV